MPSVIAAGSTFAFTPIAIPTLNDGTADYTLKVKLDGLQYTLRFLWNGTVGRWAFDVVDAQGDVLASQISVTSNWQLTRFYKWDPRMPPGEFVCYDLAGDGSPPGLFDMAPGARCELDYHPATSIT